MEKDIETKKLEIEEKKLLVEKFKALEGQARGLLILAIAIASGVGTLIINFDSYQYKEFAVVLISFGTFMVAFIMFAVVMLYSEMQDYKKRW